jgi:hypothetical protein
MAQPLTQLSATGTPEPYHLIGPKPEPPLLRILFIITVPAPSFTITVPGQGYEITVPVPDELTPIIVPEKSYIVVVPERT